MLNKIANVVTKLVDALDTLESADERRRAASAALAVFGDGPVGGTALGGAAAASGSGESAGGAADGVSTAGQAWVKRNGLTKSQIEQVFHVDGDTVSLLSAVGRGKRQQTINTYLLTGVAELLRGGKAEFSDEMARGNCTNLGCYDVANHGKTLKEFGNKITGSSKAGWKLTAPGANEAAKLLKDPATAETK